MIIQRGDIIKALLAILLVTSWAGNVKNSERLPSNYLKVPIIRQATPYSCGAAASLAILTYWQLSDESESALWPKLNTTEADGTHPSKIVEVLNQYGLRAWMKTGTTYYDLANAVRMGQTVILDIQAWRDDKKVHWKDRWEDGHYVVLVGMDRKNFYFMDPSTASGYTYIPAAELMDRWHDYETENGQRVEYLQMAIFAEGKETWPDYPRNLIPLE